MGASDKVVVLENPLLQHLLTVLRDKNTGIGTFRRCMWKVGFFMGYEISHYLPTAILEVETPLGVIARGVRVAGERVLVLAVLRAALPMAFGMLEALDDARLGVIGARRIELEDAHLRDYRFDVEMNYVGLPSSGDVVVLVDPMLATGSTLLRCIDVIEEKLRPLGLLVATVISTPLAIERVLDRRPDARIFTLSVDERLDKRGYIIPGLGDAGDRAFG